MNNKPLGGKSYGSIPHLPGSRLGPAEKCVDKGMERICCEKTRDRWDRVIIQEKLDGSNVCVARTKEGIFPLTRSGYIADTSPYELHHAFYEWAKKLSRLWRSILQPGERLCGEWIAQAHGTRYATGFPFIPFDIIAGIRRIPYDEFNPRVANYFDVPFAVSTWQPMKPEKAIQVIDETNYHEALDSPEGLIYRVERMGRVDFLAKWVRPGKVDGCYLPEITGKEPVWNWKPQGSLHGQTQA